MINKGSSSLWKTPKSLLNTANYTVDKGVENIPVQLWMKLDKYFVVG